MFFDRSRSDNQSTERQVRPEEYRHAQPCSMTAVTIDPAAVTAWMMSAPVGDPDPMALLEELTRRPEWHAQAACKSSDTAAFFPGKGGTLGTARALCGRCTVREPCLAVALADESLAGIWAGTTDRERRRLRLSRPA